jgi:hypothetical protein
MFSPAPQRGDYNRVPSFRVSFFEDISCVLLGWSTIEDISGHTDRLFDWYERFW